MTAQVSKNAPGKDSGLLRLKQGYLAMPMLIALVWLLLPTAVYAITTISQGFFTNDQASVGSIISLKKDSSDQVEVANSSNVSNLLGVVVNDGNSLLTLTSGQARQIQVATSGIVQVLVSNINGNISQGDPITASPIAGVGMRATTTTRIVGNAQEGLAGKPFIAVPILIIIGIFIITLIVVVSIIYSMIHSSIISVGRNPMSQSAIYRDLIQLSALVVGILVVAVVAIYLVLTKL
jgi:hypothetical protein